MAMSEEHRAAARERMKALHAAGRMGRKARKESVVAKLGDGVHPFMHVVDIEKPVDIKNPTIDIRVDWEKIDLTVAQQMFSHLRAVMDAAGKIINQRLSRPTHYNCEECGRMVTAGNAKFCDSAHKDRETGLIRAAYICSEECYSKYMRHKLEEKQRLSQRT